MPQNGSIVRQNMFIKSTHVISFSETANLREVPQFDQQAAFTKPNKFKRKMIWFFLNLPSPVLEVNVKTIYFVVTCPEIRTLFDDQPDKDFRSI